MLTEARIASAAAGMLRQCARSLAALIIVAVGLAVILPSSTARAASEYRLAPGDKLDISVVGIPELQRSPFVQADGTISFPLIGTVKVAGQSLPEARANITSRLALKVYKRPASDGTEQPIIIGLDDITVAVADFRPISVEGSVARPGQFAFRPAMTVREALALAGGIALLPASSGGSGLAALDVRGEYEALWLDLVKQQTAIWRLNAELNDHELDRSAIANQIPAHAPVSKETIARIVALAEDQYDTRREEFSRGEAFLKRSIEQMESQIESVAAREKEYAAAAAIDREEVERLEANLKSGTVVQTRVSDARRDLLNSETGRLQSQTELTRLAQQRDGLKQDLAKMADDQKIRVLKELEDATVRLNEVRARLQNVSEKLYATQAVAGGTTPRSRTASPVITVHRNDAAKWTATDVEETFELLPGDVVEVSLGK